jgi:hypothetical protein
VVVVGVWCLVFGVWHFVFGVWRLVFGVWCLAFWRLAFSVFRLPFAVWCLACGVGAYFVHNVVTGSMQLLAAGGDGSEDWYILFSAHPEPGWIGPVPIGVCINSLVLFAHHLQKFYFIYFNFSRKLSVDRKYILLKCKLYVKTVVQTLCL